MLRMFGHPRLRHPNKKKVRALYNSDSTKSFWTKRPLSDDARTYAASDVRFLPAAAELLQRCVAKKAAPLQLLLEVQPRSGVPGLKRYEDLTMGCRRFGGLNFSKGSLAAAAPTRCRRWDV